MLVANFLSRILLPSPMDGHGCCSHPSQRYLIHSSPLLQKVRVFATSPMSLFSFLLFFCFCFLGSSADDCPLDFTALRRFYAANSPGANATTRCRFALQGIHLAQSLYLRTAGLFLPPPDSAAACWADYQSLLSPYLPGVDVRSACGFRTDWISSGCMNLTSRRQFESLVGEASLLDVRRTCNQSLANNSPCAACTTSLSRLQATHLTGPEVGNVTDCTAYAFIYAAGAVNQFGPTDDGTAFCLFFLQSPSPPSSSSSSSSRKGLILGVVIGTVVGSIVTASLLWFMWRKWSEKRRKNQIFVKSAGSGGNPGGGVSFLDAMGSSTTVLRFTFEDIKAATRNFARDNIVGRGGFGNVYRGTLVDGSEVAVKRFKNCSAAGDASFTHEVEVIASVRHVNLLALRGYCIATTPYEGHQRMIVCDLMRNGSLHDHLFASSGKKLSWPLRQRIAIGMAKGLAYLHYGAQPAIIHRDIKASNILLDWNFEPKVADFGLAKFSPEGVTHLSTRVAGTMGYVAPEYALYGQLTEKSDVYSFGVVLLELLSGRKALVPASEGQTWLVTDWAWSLARKGRALDVIEEGMPDVGSEEVMEKCVMVAVLSSHPQLHARPTMDQIVKILETDLQVPSIPDRPISLVSNMEDIEKSVSSGSGHLSSAGGYQPFTYDPEYPCTESMERKGD